MTAQDPDVHPMQDPEGQLERALIEEFLRMRGYQWHALQALPEEESKRLLEAASVYAAGKLAEVAARAHFVHEIHRPSEE